MPGIEPPCKEAAVYCEPRLAFCRPTNHSSKAVSNVTHLSCSQQEAHDVKLLHVLHCQHTMASMIP